MNRWLADECKWARMQALEVEQRLDALLDPKELAEMRAKARRVLAATKARHRTELGVAKAEIWRLSDEHLPAAIERLEKDRAYWQQIADEQSSRLAATEETPLFEADA